MPSKPAILAIVGPTASGKSSLACKLSELSEFLPLEIVSCDSVQVYRYLDVGSAKPSPEERAKVPHHLIDVFDPDYRADVGVYKSLAENAITDVLARGKVPVVVGGTGMYFNALYYGLFDGPSRSDDLRARLDAEWEADGGKSLFAELGRCDPRSAEKVMPADKRRIVRALEACRLTGKPLTELQRDNKKLDLDWFVAGLSPDRQALYAAIESRVDAMLDAGLTAETEWIAAKFGRDAYALQSIGYRHVLKFLAGEWGMDEMAAELKKDTRHYAKRQMTWFRKNKDVHWYDPATEAEKLVSDAKAFLEGK